MNDSRPKVANGKICYLEIPAKNVNESATFFENVFSWKIRKDNYGNVAFDDTTGQVSGMWVEGVPPSRTPGIVISIMVKDMQQAINLILQNNGVIIQDPDFSANEVIARFTDPAGNIFSLYQDTQI